MSRWLRRCSQSLIEMNSSQSSLQQGRTKASLNGLSHAIWQLEHQSIFTLFILQNHTNTPDFICLTSAHVREPERMFKSSDLKPSLRKSLSGTAFWIKVTFGWKGLCFMLHSGKLGEHTDVQFTEVGFCLGKIEVQKS